MLSIVKTARALIVCSLCAQFCVSTASAAVVAEAGVPAGFEQLDAPHPTAVTLYYGGELLGTYPAHVTSSTVQFDHPGEIVKAIPTILNPAAIGVALGKSLPMNQELQCTAHRVDNCGKLTPEFVGVIYDEDHLSAELFINPADLSIVKDDKARYLPLPDRHFSSVYNLNGAISGTDGQTPNYTLGYNSTYAFGEARLDSESTVTNSGLRFDTATASIDRYGWQGQSGLFRSRSMQLISDHDIAGFSVATSRHTVLDDHKTEGNDIILYLPRRSFVSIYREGRLYSSRAYEAGNQSINTSELPDGAYNITLKIEEADGETREETRFFSKTENLPPPGSPVYYAEAGLIRKSLSQDSTMPMVTSHPLARAGTIQRLNDNTGLNLSFLGVQDRAAFEPGIFWIYQGSQLSATLMGSTRGDNGFQVSYQYTDDKFSLSSDFRKALMSGAPIPGDDTPLVRSLTQTSISAGYAITPDFTFGVRGSYAKESDMPTTASLGPYAQWNMWQSGESALSLTADAARTGSQNQASVFLRFSRRFGNYGVTGATGTSLGQNGAGPSGNIHVWHDNQTPGNSLLVAGGIDADRNDKTVSGDARWHNDVGQIEGSVQKAFGAINSPLSYGGNFAVNAAQLAGEVSVGGTQNEKSAVIIKTSGDADAAMKIYVNNTPQSTVKVGTQQVIYLTPFHKYNIRIAPEKGGLYDYDSSNHLVTLYPGNVTKLEWSVSIFYVFAAHITTPSGQALANAVLQGSKEQTTTDDKGRLQAELAKQDKLTFVTENNDTCEVQLPEDVKPARGVLLYKNPLVCTPRTNSASH